MEASNEDYLTRITWEFSKGVTFSAIGQRTFSAIGQKTFLAIELEHTAVPNSTIASFSGLQEIETLPTRKPVPSVGNLAIRRKCLWCL